MQGSSAFGPYSLSPPLTSCCTKTLQIKLSKSHGSGDNAALHNARRAGNLDAFTLHTLKQNPATPGLVQIDVWRLLFLTAPCGSSTTSAAAAHGFLIHVHTAKINATMQTLQNATFRFNTDQL